MYLSPPCEKYPAVRYLALYIQALQFLLGRLTSYARESVVDETLNQLYQDDSFELIVWAYKMGDTIAFDNIDHDLTPITVGEGAKYVDFATVSVKPWMDARYRTRPEVEHTVIMVSFLGALISLYVSAERSDVFF